MPCFHRLGQVYFLTAPAVRPCCYLRQTWWSKAVKESSNECVSSIQRTKLLEMQLHWAELWSVGDCVQPRLMQGDEKKVTERRRSEKKTRLSFSLNLMMKTVKATDHHTVITTSSDNRSNWRGLSPDASALWCHQSGAARFTCRSLDGLIVICVSVWRAAHCAVASPAILPVNRPWGRPVRPRWVWVCSETHCEYKPFNPHLIHPTASKIPQLFCAQAEHLWSVDAHCRQLGYWTSLHLTSDLLSPETNTSLVPV